MTYEVAGGGRAGSVVERRGDGPLMPRRPRRAPPRHLAGDRRTAAAQARAACSPTSSTAAWRRPPAAAAPSSGATARRRASSRALLQLHGVSVGRLARAEEVHARPLAGGEPRDVELPAGTWAVSTAQPLGELVQALLEREPPLPAGLLERQRERVTAHLEPEFYDVTAWSLPLAYNLDAWTSDDVPASLTAGAEMPAGGLSGEGRVGWLLPPSGLASYRFAAALLARDVAFRVALEPLTLGGRQLPAGTLFVPRAGKAGLEAILAPLAAAARVQLLPAESSLTGGIPLGSNQMVAIRKPRIGLVAGRGIGATSFGALWHLLDQQVGAPHSVLDLERLDAVDLGRFDVLVLPDGGGYRSALGENGAKRLADWVEAGGVLVAESGVVDWLHDQKLTSVAPHEEEPAESDGEGSSPAAADAEKVWDTELMVPGAIVATEVRAPPAHRRRHHAAAGAVLGRRLLRRHRRPAAGPAARARHRPAARRHRLAGGEAGAAGHAADGRRVARQRQGRRVHAGPGIPALLARHDAAAVERRPLRPELLAAARRRPVCGSAMPEAFAPVVRVRW